MDQLRLLRSTSIVWDQLYILISHLLSSEYLLEARNTRTRNSVKTVTEAMI